MFWPRLWILGPSWTSMAHPLPVLPFLRPPLCFSFLLIYLYLHSNFFDLEPLRPFAPSECERSTFISLLTMLKGRSGKAQRKWSTICSEEDAQGALVQGDLQEVRHEWAQRLVQVQSPQYCQIILSIPRRWLFLCAFIIALSSSSLEWSLWHRLRAEPGQ